MKIYLTGAENIGWALDTDARLAKQALCAFAEMSKYAAYSDYVHSVSPNTTYIRFGHHGDRFIPVFQGDPKRIFGKEKEDFLEFCKDKVCVAQSKQAYKELNDYKVKQVKYIPYIADLDSFYYIKDKNELKKKYGINNQKFIIGSFMRDSLGCDLNSPKLEKGPDILVQIVKQVCEKVGHDRMLVLLGGPRRHWIRGEFEKEGIPYLYIGNLVATDDIKINILPSCVVNELLNISNLVIISSRSEGGPRGILEAGATLTPIISTDVGIAKDVLSDSAIYDNISDAVEMVIRQMYDGEYSKLCEENYNNVKKNHSLEYVSGLWKEFYAEREKEHINSKRYKISINDFDAFYMLKRRFIK